MADFPVDYSAHDAAYQRLKSKGSVGWSAPDEYLRMWECVSPALTAMKSNACPRVLELGCGAGNFSIFTARAGFAVTGIDISPTAVLWARHSAQSDGIRAEFIEGNVVDLAQFEDEAFDAVVDGHCLHCIVGNDRCRCLKSVHRVLKPQGIFVVLTMCGEVRDERIKNSFDAASGLVIVSGRPTRYIGSAESIGDELRAVGFTIESLAVHPRKSDDEQDDLVVYCRKP